MHGHASLSRRTLPVLSTISDRHALQGNRSAAVEKFSEARKRDRAGNYGAGCACLARA